MCVDHIGLLLDQVLNSALQCETTIHRVLYGSMEVVEKIHFMPMRKRVWQQVNLREPQERRNLGEDDTLRFCQWGELALICEKSSRP